MKLQQYLLNHYLHIPYEDFSHKAITALGILTTIKHNALTERDAKEREKLDTSIKRVQEIIAITTEKLQISLFILDRNISPQDFSKKPVVYMTKFQRKKTVNGQTHITLSADDIQSALCNATMEINQLLMVELASFSDQMGFDSEEL